MQRRDLSTSWLLVVLVAFVITPVPGFAIDCVYDGGSANWSDATSWNGDGQCNDGAPTYPNNGADQFDVTFSAAGTATLTEDIDIRDYTQSASANLQGNQTLTINGVAMLGGGTWRELTINTLGQTNVTSNLNLDEGAIWDNASTVDWTTGTIQLNPVNNTGFGTINNQVGGLFDAQGNNFLLSSQTADGRGVFNNAGTFRKSSGTGTTNLQVDFNNTGVIDTQTGTVSFSGNGATLEHSGDIVAAAGAVVRLTGANGIYNFNTGATTTGAGDLTLANGTININANHNIATTYNQTAGTVTGAGDLTLSGVSNISSGTWNGLNVTTQNQTNVTGNLNLDEGAVWNNAAGNTVNWSGGTIQLNPVNNTGFGTINNETGSLFDAQGNNFLLSSQTADGRGVFNNAGTFRKSGATGTTSVQLEFNNTGVIDLQAGTIAFSGNGATLEQDGDIVAAAGTTVRLNGANGTYNFNAGATTTGAGSLNLANGTLNINANHDIATTFDQSGGILTGAGALTISGLSNISAGTWNGIDVTTQNQTNVTGNLGLDEGAVWNNASGNTVNWSGGTIQLNPVNNTGFGTINNESGSLFDAQGNNFLLSSQTADGRGVFNNAGTFRKSGGTGTTQIQLDFNNTGVVDVQTGTVSFSGNGSTLELDGDVVAAAGAVVRLTGANAIYNVNAGATTTGAGDLTLANGTLSINANHDIATTFNQSAGTVTGTGALTISGVSNLSAGSWNGIDITTQNQTNVTGNLNLDEGAVWNNATGNTVNWSSGTIQLNPVNNTGFGTINNETGSLFVAQGNSFLISSQTADGRGVFNNAGTFRKSGATGTTSVQTEFNNTGVIDVQSGNIAFSGNGATLNHSGDIVTAAGTSVRLNGGTGSYNFNAGATTTGGGSLDLVAGTLNVNASNVIATTFNQTGGLITGAADLTITGVTNLASSTWRAVDVTTQNTTNILNSVTMDEGAVWNNENTANWTAGNLSLNVVNDSGAGTINNRVGALLDAQSNNFITSTQTADGIGQLNNAGTFQKSGGVGSTSVFVNVDNSGSIDAQTGTIVFSRTVTNSGTVSASGGDITINGNGDVNNTGTFEALAGNSVTFQSGAGTNDNVGGDLQNGTWRAVGNGSTVSINGTPVTTNNAEIELSGAGSVFQTRNGSGGVFTQLEDSLTQNDSNGVLRVLGNRDYSTANGLLNNGEIELGGGTLAAGNVTNNGDLHGFGAVTNNVANAGEVRAVGGTLTFTNGFNGSGNARAEAGSTLAIGANSTMDNLTLEGANPGGGALSLGSNNATVNVEYNNANFGTGNAFDARANVTGTGSINAVAGTAQAITGDVTMTGANVYELSLGNFRQGDVANANFQVQNSGTGASLMGAVQNTNAGDLSVADQSFGQLAAGASSQTIAVGLNTSAAGALSGTIDVVNNFDNVANQQVVVANSGVYRMAQATISGDLNVDGNLDFGSFLDTAGVQTRTIDINNSAIADLFSEDLDVTFALNDSGAGTVTLSTNGFSNITAGDNQSLTISIDPNSLGFVNGDVTANFVSSGDVNSVNIAGLAATSIGSQVMDLLGEITGQVGQLAQASQAAPNPVTGTIRVGSAVNQNLTISNLADSLNGETLNAEFGVADAGIVASNQVSMLAGGATSNNELNITVNGVTAGNVSGNAELLLESNGEFNGNVATSLTAQQITVDVNVFNAAIGSATDPIELGNYRVGQGAVAGDIAASNLAAAGAFTEELRVDVTGSSANVTATGDGTLVAGGSSDAVGSVSIDGTTAGVVNGTVSVGFVTDGSQTSGLADLGVGSDTLAVTGTGYRMAQATISGDLNIDGNLDFGAFLDTAGVQTRTIDINNSAIADLFSEDLDVTFALNDTGAGTVTLSATGFSNIAAGDNQSLTISIDPTGLGFINGDVTANFETAGAVNGVDITGIAAMSIGSQVMDLLGEITGQVGQLAQASQVTPNPVTGTIRVGGSVNQNLTISNLADAVNGETLNAEFGTVDAGIIAANQVSMLAGGATSSNELNISVNGVTAGNVSGNAQLLLESNGEFNGNVATPLSAQQIGVDVDVFNAAVGSATGPIDLGNYRVGQGPVAGTIEAVNAADAGAFTEELRVDVTGSSANVTASGDGTLVGGGSTDTVGTVSIDGTVAGVVNGTVNVDFVSDGSQTSGLTDLSIGADVVAVTGTGYRLAEATISGDLNVDGNLDFGAFLETAGVQTRTIDINNSAIADLFSEDLNVTFALDDSGAGTVTLSTTGFSNIAAGDNQSLTISIDPTGLGFIDGDVTASFESAGAVGGANISGIAAMSIGSQVMDLLGEITGQVGQLAQASQAAPNPVTGTIRVGSSVSQNLSIANLADAINGETLNATFGTPDAGIDATGAISMLAGGAASNDDLNITVNGVTAGNISGNAELLLESNGEFNGNVATPLTSQQIGVDVDVFNAAVGSATDPIDLGNYRAGQGQIVGLIEATNSAAAGAFTEELRVDVTASSANVTAAGDGTLVAGMSTDTVGAASIDGNAVGVVSGSVDVNFVSDGSSTSGLADLNIGSDSIAVTGTGYRMAEATISGDLNLDGNLDFGAFLDTAGVQTRTIDINNSALAGLFSEDLNVTFALNDSGAGTVTLSTSGFSNIAAGDNQSLTISIDPTSLGFIDGDVTANFETAGAVNGVDIAGIAAMSIGSQVMDLLGEITGQVGQLAQASQVAPNPVTGTIRVGGAVNQNLSIANLADAINGESLNAAFGTVAAGIDASGTVSMLAGGSSSNSDLNITVNGITAGTISGTAELTLASNGEFNGNVATPLASQQIAVDVDVYAFAEADVNTASIDFGTVRVNSAATQQGIDVANVASGALVDQLGVNASATGPFMIDGVPVLLGAGQTTALMAGLDTSNAGVFNGQVDIDLSSVNPVLADAGLVGSTIGLTGTVNNLADALFDQVSGDGISNQAGNVFTVDFGDILVGSVGSVGAELKLTNGAVGPADRLGGSFDLSMLNQFVATGFGFVPDLGVGDMFTGMSIFLDTSLLGLGSISESISFNGLSILAGFDDILLPYALVFTANIIDQPNNVPEPGSVLLLLVGLLALQVRRRRMSAR